VRTHHATLLEILHHHRPSVIIGSDGRLRTCVPGSRDPGVGTTVSGSPSELTLSFTQGVVVAFSSVTVSGAGGAVPASKPVNDPSNQQIIHVRLGHALKPGSYTVTWHVLSVDTHRTEGSYHFTVS